jgi:hypothetical protein
LKGDIRMATVGMLLSSGFLLVLMVWLRWTARTSPNADLLIEAMGNTLDGRSDRKDLAP